jgi:hypothetical protein
MAKSTPTKLAKWAARLAVQLVELRVVAAVAVTTSPLSMMACARMDSQMGASRETR